MKLFWSYVLHISFTHTDGNMLISSALKKNKNRNASKKRRMTKRTKIWRVMIRDNKSFCQIILQNSILTFYKTFKSNHLSLLTNVICYNNWYYSVRSGAPLRLTFFAVKSVEWNSEIITSGNTSNNSITIQHIKTKFCMLILWLIWHKFLK